MSDAFYLPREHNRFTPTAHTTGPWTDDAQHFGPPSALLVRALENIPAAHDAVIARVTIEILGPAPLRDLTLHSHIERPGRSVELLAAELHSDERAVARASAWRIASSDTADVAADTTAPLPAVADCPPADWPSGWGGGFLKAMEWRTGHGDLAEPGPAAVWARQPLPLVDGEQPTGLQRLFALADCGNGASNRLDPRTWWFINSELTVHLHRTPTGEWVGIDAATALGAHGVGTASTTLHDTDGPVGHGAQALLVRRR